MIPAAKVTLAAPSGTSASASSVRLGAEAASNAKTPNAERRADQEPLADLPARAGHERARHRAGAHRHREQRVRRGAAVEGLAREQRQEDQEVEPERPDQRHHPEWDRERRGPRHVSKASSGPRLARGTASFGGASSRGVQRAQGEDHRPERERVQQEAGSMPPVAIRTPASAGPEDPRRRGSGRCWRPTALTTPVGADDLGHEALPGGHVDGVDRAACEDER